MDKPLKDKSALIIIFQEEQTEAIKNILQLLGAKKVFVARDYEEAVKQLDLKNIFDIVLVTEFLTKNAKDRQKLNRLAKKWHEIQNKVCERLEKLASCSVQETNEDAQIIRWKKRQEEIKSQTDNLIDDCGGFKLIQNTNIKNSKVILMMSGIYNGTPCKLLEGEQIPEILEWGNCVSDWHIISNPYAPYDFKKAIKKLMS